MCSSKKTTGTPFTHIGKKEHRTVVMSEGLNPVNFMADFKKGVNVVTVGNPEVMIPVVDAIVLTPVE